MEKESPDFDVENRMDSSRGGPLTTFIMMLPLIVVPAIAMLKPANQEGGLVSSLLSAASNATSGQQDADSLNGAPEFDGVPDEFDAIFGDSSATQSLPEKSAGSDDALFQEAAGDALADGFSADFSSSAQPPAQPQPPTEMGDVSVPDASPDADEAQLLNQLRQMGAARTLWFSPGPQAAGFVAFFPAGRGVVSYRFEAIAANREAAIRDVIQQASAWKKDQH